MRPRIPWALGLLLLGIVMAAGAASAGDRTLSVDDILRLHAAGVGDDIIISEIVVTDTVFDLDVEEILRLQEAGASERLLQFMIDTARAGTASSEDEAVAPSATEPDDEAYDDEDEQAYVVEEPTPRVFVSLNWGYPAWWYDYYWRDYWYYDCGYYPWRVSYSWACGTWYPSWYYGRCWAPAGWGYQYAWWSHHSPGWDPWQAWDRRDWVASRPQNLSEHKYKVTGGSSGKVLYTDAGLRTRDVSRLTPGGKLVVRSRSTDVALDARGKHVSDVRRPVRMSGKKQPIDVHRGPDIRRPAKPSGDHVVDRGDVRRPTRPVRKPAPVDRPVHKVTRRSVTAPKGASEVRPHPDAGTTAPDAPPAKVESRKSKSTPAPPPPSPEVRTKETRSAPPAGKASPSKGTRSAPPPPRSEGKQRSR